MPEVEAVKCGVVIGVQHLAANDGECEEKGLTDAGRRRHASRNKLKRYDEMRDAGIVEE